jgi:hypothetical protein
VVEVALVMVAVVTVVVAKEDAGATTATLPAMEDPATVAMVLVVELVETIPRSSAKSASSLDTLQIGAGTDLRRIMSQKKRMLVRQ